MLKPNNCNEYFTLPFVQDPTLRLNAGEDGGTSFFECIPKLIRSIVSVPLFDGMSRIVAARRHGNFFLMRPYVWPLDFVQFNELGEYYYRCIYIYPSFVC